MEAGGGGRRGKEEEEWGKRVLKMRDGICRPIEREVGGGAGGEGASLTDSVKWNLRVKIESSRTKTNEKLIV